MDQRSGRGQQNSNVFDKGTILEFGGAITEKLNEIITDTAPSIELSSPILNGDIILHEGSCLEILQTLKDDTYKTIITSPPTVIGMIIREHTR